MRSTKVFKTLQDQVDILVVKGLTIDNRDAAKDILFRENYFFLMGYRHVFTVAGNSDEFVKGATFEELHAMFLFDRHVRNVVFKYLLVIENNIKSIFSYRFSKMYGYKEKNYLKAKNFTQNTLKSRQVSDVLSKVKRQVRINTKKHTATQHYVNNYGYIPLWILVKVLSFGIIGELYSILKEEDQYRISCLYDLDVKTMEIYLSTLANYRNLCAHEDMLYDHRTQRVIEDTKYHRRLNIEMTNDEYIYGKNDLFAVMIIMKQILTEEEFSDFMNEVSYEVDLLDGIISSVSIETVLNKVGFPENFRDLAKIR